MQHVNHVLYKPLIATSHKDIINIDEKYNYVSSIHMY